MSFHIHYLENWYLTIRVNFSSNISCLGVNFATVPVAMSFELILTIHLSDYIYFASGNGYFLWQKNRYSTSKSDFFKKIHLSCFIFIFYFKPQDPYSLIVCKIILLMCIQSCILINLGTCIAFLISLTGLIPIALIY